MLTPVMIALLSVHYQYSPLGQVIALSNTVAGQSQSHFVAQYDKEGKQTTSNHFTYRYDGLGRLQTVTGDGQTIRYRFDLASNMKDWPTQTNPPALSYNSAGNLRHTPQGGILDYNVLNQLTQYQANGVRTAYLYNGNDLRLAKIGPQQNQLFFYGPNARLWNIDKNGEMQAYLFGQHRLANLSGKLYFYLYDLHGDVVQLVTPQGKVVSTYAYGPYGRNTTNTKEDNNPFRYVGGYFDSESGLQYQQARYRLPGEGFITRDYAEQWNGASFPFDATNVLTMNEYAFAGGDPVGNKDPAGHSLMNILTFPSIAKYITSTNQPIHSDNMFDVITLKKIFNPNDGGFNCGLVAAAACKSFMTGIYHEVKTTDRWMWYQQYDVYFNPFSEEYSHSFKVTSADAINKDILSKPLARRWYFSKSFFPGLRDRDSMGIVKISFSSEGPYHTINYVYRASQKEKGLFLHDFQQGKTFTISDLVNGNAYSNVSSTPSELTFLPVFAIENATYFPEKFGYVT